MERLSFIHLSGPRRGEIDVLPKVPATLGSAEDAQVVVPGTAPHHARLVPRGSDLILEDAGSDQGTFLAGEAVHEAPLRDGDVLELGSGGPKLRFRHEGEKRVPFFTALQWARPEGAPNRLSDTTAFFRAVVRETAQRTSRLFWILTAVALLAAAGLLGWSYQMSSRLQRQLAAVQESLKRSEQERKAFQGRVEEERRRARAERQNLAARAEEFRLREEELRNRLTQATSGEVQTLRSELTLARERLESLESERAAGERIIRDYGSGVCLIQGSYSFHDASGRPLRAKLDEGGKPEHAPDGSLRLDVEGEGPIHTAEYLGTGFLVDRTGLILTNRHVAEPWWNDESADALAAAGFRPRFVFLRAFFPKLPGPQDLRLERLSENVDLALMRASLGSAKVPVLPLDLTGTGAVAGRPVVVVGYPTGLEAILAKADSAVVQEILSSAGMRSEQVTDALSRKGLIRPSTTQGHIGDITKTDIVFDAPTTQGGSGGPIFNRSGNVIAVEYAVLPKFGGNAFGVPIRNAVELLKPRKAPPGD